MIRVWIDTTSAVTRAGFESLLDGSEGIEVINSMPDADVILREELPDTFESPGAAPLVVITDGPVTRQALQIGVRAILPREAASEQIVAALYAAA